MWRIWHQLFISIFLSLFISINLHGQTNTCPVVNAGPDVTIICGGCTTLTATVQGTFGTSTYNVSNIPYDPYTYYGGTSVIINTDDIWSNIIPLPFCFQFFGKTYDKILIGSNAIITFDTSLVNEYCQWGIIGPIPTIANPMNSIMAPYHDIDPSIPVIGMPNSLSNINYAVYGTPPCRKFVISWDSVALFKCNSLNATSQLVLYENSNIIDVYIREKTTCTTWNGGRAIEGIQNETGTVAYTVIGRNSPTQWTANNDGQRFMPTGPPSNYTFAWFDPLNNVISNSQTIVVCPTNTSTYRAQIINGTCSSSIVTDQTTVTVSSGSAGNLMLSMTSISPLCNGDANGSATAIGTGGIGPYTYLWQPTGQTSSTITGLIAGSYNCTITDANGCVITQTIIISQPNILSSPITTIHTSCGESNGSASASISGGTSPFNYEWIPTGGNNATATGLNSGTYTLKVIDANGCLISDSITINGSTGTTASFKGIDTTGCAPICVKFTNTSPTSVSCLWNFGDNTSSINSNETHCYVNTGEFILVYPVNLIVTDIEGCTASTTHTNMVQVYPQPTANFIANPDTASELNPNIEFTNISTNSNLWFWFFEDLIPTNSTLENPSHTYNDTGAYGVTLIVSNLFGCEDTITGEIYIAPRYTFFSPNAFTPNGDGRNDLFFPIVSGFRTSTFHMMIFDRWGNLIFESSDLYKGWNGCAKEGKDIAQMDTYIWKVSFTDWLNVKHEFGGKITLIK